jgi:hypothetical protein
MDAYIKPLKKHIQDIDQKCAMMKKYVHVYVYNTNTISIEIKKN